MGNSNKREAVSEFISTGELPPLPEGVEGVDDVPNEPLDADWLADILERRKRLRTNPLYELPRYRDFFKQPDLTVDEVDHLLESMEVAASRPEDFYDSIVEEESIFGAIKSGASCAIKIPRYFPTRSATPAQVQQVQALAQDYPVLQDIAVNPNEHQYEMCDPRWWPLLREKVEEAMQRWPKGLAPFRPHTLSPTKFVYTAEKPTTKLALLADFGVGQYHSECIARQLLQHAYPYIFHLGDVYYGGSQGEFDHHFSRLLDPVLANGSTLFGLPENHELYSGGKSYLAFLDRHRTTTKHMVQEGSYFCVRFPKHQFIGLDVNWLGRQRFKHEASRKWLTDRLHEGTQQKLTTILLTGSAPFNYGDSGTTKLYDDMLQWSEQGHFAMWFWGDDHYCALFDRTDRTNYIGSCIGHGGYPGGVRRDNEKCFVKPIWVETEPRFPKAPAYSELRHDLANNGWCELELLDDGGVQLMYVDWLGGKRLRARFGWEQALIPRFTLVDSERFDRSELY
jgi:hypothetical protein